jgi:quinol monooxygenase YgiN
MAISGTAAAFELPPNGSGPLEMLSVLHVKPEKFPSFMKAMEANVLHSRGEPGNVGFDVFQPVSGQPTLYVLEQWQDPSFTKAHLQQQTLLDMHKAAAVDLESSIAPLVLSGVTPGTGVNQEGDIAHRARTTNALVYLSVKPEARQALIDGLNQQAPHYRAESGNLGYDVFQSKSTPDTLVLLERWTTPAHEKASRTQPASKAMRTVYHHALAKPLDSDHLALKDITGS